MRKITRNVATGLAASALAVGAVLPALAQDGPEEAAQDRTSVATDHDPVQARVQDRDAARDPDLTEAEREELLEERAAFRAARDAEHVARVEAAVQDGDLTREQADEMLAARQARADRGGGQGGPGAGGREGGPGAGGPVAGGRGMGPGEGSGPHEDCPLRDED